MTGMPAPVPGNEQQRIEALQRYKILDTLPEQSFDDIALLASEICGTPIAAISLVDNDRQWFKSMLGLDVRETSRDVAFCAHTILNTDEPLVVEDTLLDQRFADNALVVGDPRIRFYAGVPLRTAEGLNLGSLCVIDRTPRELKRSQLRALAVLSREVMARLELRRNVSDLEHTIVELRRTEVELERSRQEQLELKDQLISHVSHELRSPLTVMYGFITLLRDGIAGPINPVQREQLEVCVRNAEQLKKMIGDLLEVTRAQSGKLSVESRRMRLETVIRDAVQSLAVNASDKRQTLSCQLPPELPEVIGDAGRVRQVLVNLVENAFKFSPDGATIVVHVDPPAADAAELTVSVTDTGCGLRADDCERVFEHLYQVPSRSASSRNGLGLGLHICRELVSRQGGRIWVESELGMGSTFRFTLPTFDLARILEPLMTTSNVARGSLAVLRVDLCVRESAGDTQLPAAVVHAARQTISACVNPSMDVVLPGLGGDWNDQTVVVVAMADAQGVGLVARRIEEQLSKSRTVAEAECTWHVGVSLLEFASPQTPAALQAIATRVAGIVDAQLCDSDFRKAA